ncbi:IclR family transcriptional regulator [Neobacillus bataviensis LMG 21833]|uniref:IclR family transcriptional regulator n=1 Tax=Neobacillus bataviensis LMG 21833 TaxID=1117379 RepID=K6DTF3_9BACI|nr:IclR family transcriptional regulator [Neobacillus bataviensis]EKN71649.1 IclR family transcriptional regulator [Neobacillus bataviensis LMG 21833]
MSESKRTSYGNVSHALDILLFFREHEDCSLGEMAEMLEMKKSYLSKLLHDMEEKGFISQDTSTGKYQLGLSCLEVGNAYEKRLDIRKVAHPHLIKLSSATNELVHLGVLDSNIVVLLDRIMNQGSGLRLQFHLSLTSPPYATGLGKVLLAYSDPKMVDDYLSTAKLEPHSPHTTVDPNMILAELEQIRLKGYYLSFETFESGISCVAAPVFSRHGKIAAAISICAPSIRIMSKQKELVNHLLENTSEISSKLGHGS